MGCRPDDLGDRRGGGAGVEVDDVGDDHGDVVRGSGAHGELHEPVGRGGDGTSGREHLFDGVPGHEAGQAVRAEQEPVAGTGFPDHEVRLVAVAAGQDACHEGALRVAVGLLLGDAALVDEGLHEGVVVGDLVELLAPQEVSPRVTDVGERHLVTCAQERGHRGAHALELGAVVDLRLDLGVGGRNGPAEVVVRVVATVALPVEGHHGADGDGAGDVASGVASHAVGDHEEVGAGIPGVLVLRADQSHVGAGCVVERDLHVAVVSSSTRRQSCRCAARFRPPPPRVR